MFVRRSNWSSGKTGHFGSKGDGLSLEFDSLEEGQAFIYRLPDDQNEAIKEYFAGTL
jgi:hypothetical protein